VREKLLFIAPNVPLFDRFSGDLRLFTILNILSKSHEITYFAKNWANWAVDKSLEKSKYVSRLNDLGISVYYGDSHTIKDILKSIKFKMSIIEFYHVAEQYLPRIRLLQPSCKIIVDTVDVHYLRLHRKFKLTKDINDFQLAEATKAKELDIYSQADIVLTVTDEDARNLENETPNMTIRILPNVHELIYPTGTRNRNEMIFVGGFDHEPNIDAIIYFCEDILPRIRKVIPDARFTIVGSNPPTQIKNLSNDFITVTGYVSSTTPYLQKSYVSVAPLRYGAGMKGKIGEAMAHGLPVVTTSIGAEGMGLTDRENVFIADSPETFSDAVIELMHEDNLYKKIQKNSLAHISKNFTPEKVGSQIEHILSELGELTVKKMSLLNKASFLLDYTLDFVKRRLPIIAR
jgi:O-antigen biosynthesis protein